MEKLINSITYFKNVHDEKYNRQSQKANIKLVPKKWTYKTDKRSISQKYKEFLEVNEKKTIQWKKWAKNTNSSQKRKHELPLNMH